MAATRTIEITPRVWVEVAIGPLTDCLVSANRGVLFAYATGAPIESVRGHFLAAEEWVNAVPEDGESFWVLAERVNTLVTITERAT